MKKAIISCQDLNTWYPVKSGLLQKVSSHVKAVQGVSLEIFEGELVSLVGESGSGKSTLGYSLLGLEKVHSGEIKYEGKAVRNFEDHRRDFQIIYQDSGSSLNPRLTIYETLKAPLLHYKIVSNDECFAHCVKLMLEVGLKEEHLLRYPHAFSGGQRQRLNIARTLALKPKFVVCDEIVSALDVVVQSQILDLLLSLREKYKMSVLFITHDLAVAKKISDRIVVMQNGKIVEEGTSLFENPQHPYTQKLISSIPHIPVGWL